MITATAAKLRVQANENHNHGGIQCKELAQQVARDIGALRHPERHGWLHDWQSCSIHKIIWEEVTIMRHRGIDASSMLRHTPTGDTEQDRSYREEARKHLQAMITKEIGNQENFDPHYRIRNKLARWKLPGTPRVQGDRFQRFLCQLKGKTTPRVQAAVLKTAWN